MTRYDPFSYGQVKLADKQGPAADSPDDMLFADAGPKKQPPPAADSSWALLEESVDKLLPSASASSVVEFGADILGESAAAASPVAPPVGRPRPATAPQPAVPRSASDQANAASGASNGRPIRGDRPKEVRPKASVDLPAVAKAPAAAALPAGMIRRRRSSPLLGVLVPFVLCAGGGTAASWFAISQQNPVMAGIIGLLTLVSAAFAWLSLRP